MFNQLLKRRLGNTLKARIVEVGTIGGEHQSKYGRFFQRERDIPYSRSL
jgi:hypothetical protein